MFTQFFRLVCVAAFLPLLAAAEAKADTVVNADLLGAPSPAMIGDKVTFTGSLVLTSPDGNQITITSVDYTVDFGDGKSVGPLNDAGPFPNGKGINPASVDETATHTYKVPGIYNVFFDGTVSFTLACAVKPCADPQQDFTATFPEVVLAAEVPEPSFLPFWFAGLPAMSLIARRRMKISAWQGPLKN